MSFSTINHRSTSDNSFTTPTTQAAHKVPADVEDFLDAKNLEFLTSLTPTVTFLVVLATVGVVGNSLVLLVYFKRFKPSVTRTYILAMSLVDLTTNICCLPTELPNYIVQYSYYSWACKVSTTVLGSLALGSGFILVAVAVDRRRHICQRQSRTLESARKARTAVLACVLVSVLMNSPRVYFAHSHTVHFSGTNITGVVCVDLDHSQSVFALVYGVVLNVAFWVGLVVMVVCYVTIARHLRQHKTRRAAQSDGRHQVTMETTFVSDTTDTDQDNKQHVNTDVHTDVKTDVNTDVHADVKSDVNTDVRTVVNPDAHTVHSEKRSQANPHKSAQIRGCSGRVSVQGKKISYQTTLMFFVLTVVCIANYVPYLSVVFTRERSAQLRVPDLDPNLSHLMLRSYYLNSAVNPFVYSFFSARFRLECRRLLRLK